VTGTVAPGRWFITASVLIENPVGQFFHAVHQQVRGGIGQRFGLEPVGDATARNAGVAGGLNVHGAVADHQGAVAADAGLFPEGLHADGVGLLEVETIAAVDLEEVVVHAQAIDDQLADANRLVGEHGHALARRMQPLERFPDAGVEGGVIQVVLAVVLEKKLEGFLDLRFAGRPPSASRINDGAPWPT